MKRQAPSRRKATTLVETAMVISVMLLFMFGVYEYGRFISVLQVFENAAREGSRMAVAHTNDKVTADITARVTDTLAGMGSQVDDLQISIGGTILQPQDTTETVGQVLADWTQASTTDGIVVTITGTYRPVTPSFLGLSTSIPIRTSSTMYSEGN